MPNRIIKESICTSDSIDSLGWFEEVLFYRLIVNCDDFGRFDGRMAVIKNRLFPLKENLTLKNVELAVNKLARAGLVSLYEYDGRPFLYLPTWNEHQTIRAKQSKYPEPSESNCKQMISDASKCSRNPIQYEYENIKRKESLERKEKAPEVSEDMLGGFSGELREAVDDWLRYKAERRQAYKETGLKSVLTQISKNAKLYGDAAVVDVIRQSMANNYQGITFDKLKNKPKVSQSISQSVTKAQPQRTVTDADLVEYPYSSGKWMPYWEADKLREAGK
jgi:hypothetical protein